jgi:hypothetical protein
MNSDIAHEMSVKSIASAITGDDAAVRPRSFRRDGAVLPARALQRRARLPGRDATLLLNGVGDRVNTQRSIGIAREPHGSEKPASQPSTLPGSLWAPRRFADASLPR